MPLQIIYSDLWGPSPILAVDRKRYYVLFVDQFSKYMWLHTIQSKHKVLDVFKTLHPLLERRFQTKILSFYTDGGGEFQSSSYLKSQGIERLISPPYTPQRVAVVERRHRHVVETAKTLMHQASLPSTFWIFACHQAVFLINRMTTPNLKDKCPYELLFQESPNYDNVKIFGCLCYPWLKPYAQHKLDSKSKPCVYLGFSNKYYCHQCFDPTTSKVYLSRDVVFFETSYPFTNIFSKYKNQHLKISWDDLSPSTEMHNDIPTAPHCLELPQPLSTGAQRYLSVPSSAAPPISGTPLLSLNNP